MNPVLYHYKYVFVNKREKKDTEKIKNNIRESNIHRQTLPRQSLNNSKILITFLIFLKSFPLMTHLKRA